VQILRVKVIQVVVTIQEQEQLSEKPSFHRKFVLSSIKTDTWKEGTLEMIPSSLMTLVI